jgi:hypothetical protein
MIAGGSNRNLVRRYIHAYIHTYITLYCLSHYDSAVHPSSLRKCKENHNMHAKKPQDGEKNSKSQKSSHNKT